MRTLLLYHHPTATIPWCTLQRLEQLADCVSHQPSLHNPAPTRYCIGGNLAMAEMKVFLAFLARSYDFSVDGNTDWLFAIGRVPKNGLPMTITRGVPAAAIDQPVTAGAVAV